jgi:hypothetical protein
VLSLLNPVVYIHTHLLNLVIAVKLKLCSATTPFSYGFVPPTLQFRLGTNDRQYRNSTNAVVGKTAVGKTADGLFSNARI